MTHIDHAIWDFCKFQLQILFNYFRITQWKLFFIIIYCFVFAIVSLMWKYFFNTELCNVLAQRVSHVANSRNVNNRWDRCLANDWIHTEFLFFYSRAILECWHDIKCIIQYSLECVPSVYEPIFNLYTWNASKNCIFSRRI